MIRVVSSVDKKLEVKPRFLDIFREDSYPTEFAYKSKVRMIKAHCESMYFFLEVSFTHSHTPFYFARWFCCSKRLKV